MAGAPEGKTYAWRLCGWGARPGLDPPSPLSESQYTNFDFATKLSEFSDAHTEGYTPIILWWVRCPKG